MRRDSAINHVFADGDYGVTVNTRVCGALDSSSILDSRPRYEYLVSYSGVQRGGLHSCVP